jgi:hypothetical protein
MRQSRKEIRRHRSWISVSWNPVDPLLSDVLGLVQGSLSPTNPPTLCVLISAPVLRSFERNHFEVQSFERI